MYIYNNNVLVSFIRIATKPFLIYGMRCSQDKLFALALSTDIRGPFSFKYFGCSDGNGGVVVRGGGRKRGRRPSLGGIGVSYRFLKSCMNRNKRSIS